ncbi:MAG: RluA family pseudouridine synthase [Muribaculaceae bacterium]|nr:RluA family pseudouridine synthase [Muribaculaceae bacterium]
MNNPFDYIPDSECDEAFDKLVAGIETIKNRGDSADLLFCRELEAGKMLGVMIAKDKEGKKHTMYAFSGQLGDHGFNYPGFVGPVFDYLDPDGYFKTNESYISRQNKDIADFEETYLLKIKQDYEKEKDRLETLVSDMKERNRLSKLERTRIRETGFADEADLARMIRQSQYEKAELHRFKKQVKTELEPFAGKLKEAEARLASMKEKRRRDSETLQQWLFSNFKLLNSRGENKSLSEIFAETSMKIPPSGAGECCAPKLLQAAYLRGWEPVSIAEYWYGKPKAGEVRRHGDYYPACRGKCLPVLNWMLQGLSINPPLDEESSSTIDLVPRIIYENEWFCVVDKPAGMLSVPGKGISISLQQWLEKRYGSDREVKTVHRLDQDTSGLVIATFGRYNYKIMQSLFAWRKVTKTYIAELEGDYTLQDIPQRGIVELPLSPDWLDRPRQRVNYSGGKEALTEYEFIGVSEGRSRIIFHPHTGRTHQLRVHAASQEGLGMPIAGDRLYGKNGGKGARRLHLHAWKIEFQFPINGIHYSFESPVPF